MVIFKLLATTRLQIGDTFAVHFSGVLNKALALDYAIGDSRFNLKEAIVVNYGTYGLGPPRVLWKIASDYPDVEIFALGVAVGVLIFTHLQSCCQIRVRLA